MYEGAVQNLIDELTACRVKFQVGSAHRFSHSECGCCRYGAPSQRHFHGEDQRELL